MPRRPAPPLLGPGLVHRRLRVGASDALLVKAVVEAHEGVASVFGEAGGDLTLASPCDREAELDALIEELERLVARRR